MFLVPYLDKKRERHVKYTKHYYAGSQRVASKIGTAMQLGVYPIFVSQNIITNFDVESFKDKGIANTNEASTKLIDIYSTFEVSPPNLSPAPYQETVSSYHHQFDEGASLEMFYFHSDHLGSSNFITNIVGEISQHMEYTAFGEMFVEEHKNSNNSPYKFNAKELDEETGNYYYGARYYNPKWSVWLSVDPLAEKYPGWSPYNYTLNNPVRFTDPTGMVVEESQGPTDHWKLNDSGKLELIKKTDDDFNVFFDENGNKLFQTNEQSEELKSEEWEGKSDEYINKMKTVFIEIANEEEVYNTMEQRAEETGFDESIITLEQMKSVGNEYQDIGPILGVLDGIKEAPKWGVNPGSAAKSILQQAGKSIYKGSTGTDITKDVKNYANRAWQGIKDFATDFSNGTFMDYFILK